jgi:hypothetical protein
MKSDIQIRIAESEQDKLIADQIVEQHPLHYLTMFGGVEVIKKICRSQEQSSIRQFVQQHPCHLNFVKLLTLNKINFFLNKKIEYKYKYDNKIIIK